MCVTSQTIVQLHKKAMQANENKNYTLEIVRRGDGRKLYMKRVNCGVLTESVPVGTDYRSLVFISEKRINEKSLGEIFP